MAVIENERGEVLNVGRRTRTIPPAIQRVHAHHIRHWAQGGETKLSNLVSLCHFHHRKVHEGRVVVEVLDDGALRFVTPEGKAFESAGRDGMRVTGDVDALRDEHRARGIAIDPRTAASEVAWRKDGPWLARADSVSAHTGGAGRSIWNVGQWHVREIGYVSRRPASSLSP